jgi:hypothetical protein
MYFGLVGVGASGRGLKIRIELNDLPPYVFLCFVDGAPSPPLEACVEANAAVTVALYLSDRMLSITFRSFS